MYVRRRVPLIVNYSLCMYRISTAGSVVSLHFGQFWRRQLFHQNNQTETPGRLFLTRLVLVKVRGCGVLGWRDGAVATGAVWLREQVEA